MTYGVTEMQLYNKKAKVKHRTNYCEPNDAEAIEAVGGEAKECGKDAEFES